MIPIDSTDSFDTLLASIKAGKYETILPSADLVVGNIVSVLGGRISSHYPNQRSRLLTDFHTLVAPNFQIYTYQSIFIVFRFVNTYYSAYPSSY